MNGHLENQSLDTQLLGFCADGERETVLQLLTEGADPNTRNEDGKTPLHLASQNGHSAAVQLLLSRGAHIDILDKWSWSPLHEACNNQHVEVVDILLSSGANPFIQDNDCQSALHVASMKGNLPIVIALLESGADVTLQDIDGFSALMWACLWGHGSVVSQLVSGGAEIGSQNEEGLTALIIATKNSNSAIVATLLSRKNNAHINYQEKTTGWSALFFAAKEGHLEITKTLIQAGANTMLKDKNGVTALQVAIANDWEEVSDELAEHMEEFPGQRRLSLPSLKSLASQSGQQVAVLFSQLEQKIKTTAVKLRKPRSYDAIAD